jgi:hypothetical protein
LKSAARDACHLQGHCEVIDEMRYPFASSSTLMAKKSLIRTFRESFRSAVNALPRRAVRVAVQRQNLQNGRPAHHDE